MGIPVIRAFGAVAAFAAGTTAAAPTIELASRGAFLAPIPTNGQSFQPAASADGRYVVFTSQATNLGAPDTNGFNDIYLADRVAGTFTLVSRSAATASDGASASPAISADGARIAFVSTASNLVAGDVNDVADVFVRERATGSIRRLLPPGGMVPLLGALSAQISADGRYVAIETSDAWVASGDTNNAADVYVYDLTTDTVERATIGNAGEQPANLGFDVDRFSLAGNGRCVAFTTSTAMEASDTGGLPDVYLRDLDSDTTVLVTVTAAGVAANSDSGGPWVSPDCTRVAFLSSATNLDGSTPNYTTAAFEKTLAGGAIARIWPAVADPATTTLVQRVIGSRDGAHLVVSTATPASSFVDGPIIAWRRATGTLVTSGANVQGLAGAITDDGALVVYATQRPVLSTDRNAAQDLALFDTAGGARIALTVPATTVTSLSGNGSSGIGEGFSPLMRGQFRQQFVSDDGLLVAYASIANNLVAADDNGFEDVFVLDRRTGTNQRVTRGLGGAEPNGDSGVTDMSSDGRWLVVESCASNLVVGDTNGICDLFVVDRTATPPVFERVNVDSGEVQANLETSLAFNGGHFGSISADARFVVFASTATNLVPGDTNNQMDIFLRDRTAGGTTVLLSRTPAGGFPDRSSFQPRISADGRFASFRSQAQNLGGPRGQLWVVDTTTFVHEIASVTSDEVPMGASNRSFISADGRYVAFVGFDGTVPGDTDGQTDVFVRDRMLGKTTLASLRPDGTHWTVSTFIGGLSSRGLILPFIVDEGASTGGAAYSYDISTGRIERIYAAPAGSSQSLRPAASANGRHLAVAHNGVLTPSDQNGAIWDIYYATNFTSGISGGAEGAAPELALSGASVSAAEMGEAVAISDQYIVAGAPGANEVYIYERPAGSTGTTMRGFANAKSAKNFNLVATLAAPGGGALGDKWGAAVAISPDGNVVAIGVPGVGAGQVAVFQRPMGGWNGSVGSPQMLNAQVTGNVTPDDFGTSLEIAEDGRLVVGAPMTDLNGVPDAGYAVVYTPQAGNNYTQSQELVPPTTQAGAAFGMDVAINANAIAIGSPLEDDGGNIDEGTVYTYASAGTNQNFTASATIDPPNGGAFGDKWGMGVGLGDNSLAIGAPGMDTAAGADSGAAYVYQSPTNTFGTAPATELAPPRDAPGEAIGTSVEIAGDYVVIGAPLADRLNVADTGTAFVFERPELGWQTRQQFLADIELRASESQADQEFGDAVAVTRQGLVVGVPRRDVGAVPDQGEADTFVFDRILRAGFE